MVASAKFQNSAQMGLAQNNDVVHTFTPDRSDQPFDSPFCHGEAGAIGLSRMQIRGLVETQALKRTISEPLQHRVFVSWATARRVDDRRNGPRHPRSSFSANGSRPASMRAAHKENS